MQELKHTLQIHSKWSWERHHRNSMEEWVVDWCIAVTIWGWHVSRGLFLHQAAFDRASLS